MRWLEIPYVDEAEQIDDPGQPIADLTASMEDVAGTNRWFGGTATVVGHIDRMVRNWPVGSADTTYPAPLSLHPPVSGVPARSALSQSGADRVVERGGLRILDVGTGSADIPIALIEWGRRSGRPVQVTAVDNQPKMLAIATSRVGRLNEVQLVRADATALPFQPGSFDIGICALTFHHLGFDRAAEVLSTLDRLCIGGFVVTDLRRDLISLGLIEAGLRLVGAHPITRHDGPASVRRAFTVPEYRKLVALSGVQGVCVYTHWYYRVALVKERPAPKTPA